MSGRGTSLALTGAYLLAEALAQYPNEHARAFEKYERQQRPRASNAQATAGPGGDLLVPATRQAEASRNRRLTVNDRRANMAILDDYAGVSLGLADCRPFSRAPTLLSSTST